jgi:predicted transcriptional regulator
VKREATLSNYYCGYDIEGDPVPAPYGTFSWALEVLRDSQSIFILEIGIPWNDLSAKGLERDQAIAYVGQEGLHRITGRLSLGWFKAEEHYRHTIAKGEERVEPPLTEADSFTFASDEERAEYWLLRALYHIRAEYPGLYRNVQFDWRGVCIVTHTPVKTGRLALDLLSERELISKLHYVKGTTKNGWEIASGSISIAAPGVEYCRYLEQTIRERVEESETMSTIEIQRKILEVIIDIQQEPNKYVGDTQIAEKFELDMQEVRDHLDLMQDAGFIKLVRTKGGYSAYPTPLGRTYLRDPAYVQQASLSQGTQITIEGSTVGAINTGNIQKLESVINQVTNQEDARLADALKELTNAILESQEITEAVKDELIEQLTFLAEQITTPKESRKLTIAKTVFDAITGLIRTAPALLVLWDRYGPMIEQALK